MTKCRFGGCSGSLDYEYCFPQWAAGAGLYNNLLDVLLDLAERAKEYQFVFASALLLVFVLVTSSLVGRRRRRRNENDPYADARLRARSLAEQRMLLEGEGGGDPDLDIQDEVDADGKRFLLAQYYSLREEILAQRERSIRIVTLGFTAIPVVIGTGVQLQISELIISGPFIVASIFFLAIYEQSSIMRAGQYIKDYIEPELIHTFTGWERFLEVDPVRRRPEGFFNLAISIVFSMYFAGSAYLAVVALHERWPGLPATAIGAVYLLFFFFALWFIARAPSRSTDPRTA